MSPSRPVRGAATGKRFVIVASQFNRPITLALIRGATSVLHRSGASASNIRVLWVPGAFELPVVASRVARARPRPDAIIALGALIRGETPQYEVLAQAVAQGLMDVAVRHGIPVTFGVIVAASLAQAKARAGLPAPPLLRSAKQSVRGQAGGAICNRGEEAALAALAVLQLFNKLRSSDDRAD